MPPERPLEELINQIFNPFAGAVASFQPAVRGSDIGTVASVGQGVVRVLGLSGVESEELVLFQSGALGVAFNIDVDEIGVILLDPAENIAAGSEVQRTGRLLDVPVGEALLGRVVSPMGMALDNGGPLLHTARMPVERPAPSIMDRAAVSIPLQTGLKVVDALIPIGRGQRQLILGDRQTGKTALAIDTILNQGDKNVVCIFCAIGKRATDVIRVVNDLRNHGAMERSIVVAATEENPPGLQFVAPYAATTIGEYFMEKGRDVLIVYDDLTHHARAYRELSLLMRRPPGREAFPGDIFYIHSRLLERSTHLREELGGGSLTALPIVETEAQNLSAYIPTNLISITDGQIYLSPDLYQKGMIPAVDVGKSVSRVGGKTQPPAYRLVSAGLRLSYAQFEELEAFSRFGSRLDDKTRSVLDRGRRVREILKQSQYRPMSVASQVAVLVAVVEGLLDSLPLESIAAAETLITESVARDLSKLSARVERGEPLGEDDMAALRRVMEEALKHLPPAPAAGDNHGNH